MTRGQFNNYVQFVRDCHVDNKKYSTYYITRLVFDNNGIISHMLLLEWQKEVVLQVYNVKSHLCQDIQTGIQAILCFENWIGRQYTQELDIALFLEQE